MIDFSVFKSRKSPFAGLSASSVRGQGSDFDSLRAFADGDDSASIDWKSSLRSGRLSVRSFLAEKDVPVWIVLDDSPTLGFGNASESRMDGARTMAQFLFAAASAVGYRTGFVTYSWSVRFAPSTDASEFKKAFKAFETKFSQESDPQIRRPDIRFLRTAISEKSSIFFLSDAFSESPAALRKSFKGSYLHFIRIAHALDGAPRSPFSFFATAFGGLSLRKRANPNSIPDFSDFSPFEAELTRKGIPACAYLTGSDPYPAIARLFQRTYG